MIMRLCDYAIRRLCDFIELGGPSVVTLLQDDMALLYQRDKTGALYSIC